MSVADGRTALVVILEDAGVTVGDDGSGDPPRVVILQDGTNMATPVLAGRAEWSYRVVAIAGAWDSAGASAMLAGLVSAVTHAIHAADGWRITRVTADRIARVAGADHLVADVYASTIITI